MQIHLRIVRAGYRKLLPYDTMEEAHRIQALAAI